MKRIHTLILLAAIATLIGLAGCGAPEGTLTMLAAASVANPLDSLVADFQDTYGVTVRVGYGASGTLAQQIRAGAGADLYLTADTAWMQRLEFERGNPVHSWSPIATSRLVVIDRDDSERICTDLSSLTDPRIERIAIADPQVAPAGRYARAALESAGIYDRIEQKLVYSEHVTAAVNSVRVGAADVGFAYATDVRGFENIRTAYIVPENLHPPIVYGLAIMRSASQNRAAQSLADFLHSRTAAQKWQNAGFLPLMASGSEN